MMLTSIITTWTEFLVGTAERYLLGTASRERQPAVGPVELGALNRYDRPLPNLADYERLRQHWPVTEVVQ